jgi:hypothetical protein
MSNEITAKNQEKIGKGNPPKVYRFKPGQSGNPCQKINFNPKCPAKNQKKQS